MNLVGAWSLCSWTISYADGRAEGAPFGDTPQGLLIYSKEGWMSAAIGRNERPALEKNRGLRQQRDATLAEAFRSYFHYAGPYEVQGSKVLHTVTQSLNPGFVGSVQERDVQFDGQNLILSGSDTVGSVSRRHRLVWEPASAPGGAPR